MLVEVDMSEKKRVKLRDSVNDIYDFIQEHVWQLDPSIVPKWIDVSKDIERLVALMTESGKELNAPTEEEIKSKIAKPDVGDPLLRW